MDMALATESMKVTAQESEKHTGKSKQQVRQIDEENEVRKRQAHTRPGSGFCLRRTKSDGESRRRAERPGRVSV